MPSTSPASAERPAANAGIGTRLDDPPVNFAQMAQAYGLYGEGPIVTPDAIRPALERALRVVKDRRPLGPGRHRHAATLGDETTTSVHRSICTAVKDWYYGIKYAIKAQQQRRRHHALQIDEQGDRHGF